MQAAGEQPVLLDVVGEEHCYQNIRLHGMARPQELNYDQDFACASLISFLS